VHDQAQEEVDVKPPESVIPALRGAALISAALMCAAPLSAPAAGLPTALLPFDEARFAKLLAGNRGKIVLLNFWATWCEPCRHELPALAELERRLRRRGLVVATVSADDPEQEKEAIELLRKSGIPEPAYITRARNDEAFIDFIDPKWSGALPAMFLYDREGRRAASFIGETDAADIEQAARKLL
jgi:thiol-disulfide isomerase/thioredoxin